MNLLVVGTGAITKSMLAEFARSDALRCSAICSRKEETGRAMAEQFGIPTVYTSYEEALADPAIDIVYIGLPNILHYTYARAALEAGKHVLCEKPFTPTVAEAEALISLAKEKHLLLFETITTAHNPNYQVIRENLHRLGNVKLVDCVFCQFSSRYPALLEGRVSPVLDPAYKGGALMDINLYNIHFVLGLFGAPDRVRYRPNLHTNGVDTSGVLSLEYPTMQCQCVGAKDSAAENGSQIIGEKGYIHAGPSSSSPLNVKICIRGQEPEIYTLPENPWYYEVQSLSRLVAAMDYDACYAALDTTLEVVRVLEQARLDGGLGF